MKVLFLDIDGVLNSQQYFRLQYRAAQLLDLEHKATQLDPMALTFLDIIIEDTDCQVVISSVWRFGRTVPQLIDLLRSRGFRHTDHILDKTPDGCGSFRGLEIQSWLDANREQLKVESFVILDDDSDMGDLLPHLINIDGKEGLTGQKAGEVIDYLNNVE